MRRDRHGGWVVHAIDPHARVMVDAAMPSLDVATERAVARHWDELKARLGGGIFNGKVFCADVITPDRIGGHWTEFRRLAAQMVEPALFAALRVRSLSVNGIVLSPDGVVFGRRPANALYQAGLWQLAPAGSVDPTAARPDGSVDLLAQAATELAEELGIGWSDVTEAVPVAIVEHPATHVCDVGVLLRTQLDGGAIRDAHAGSGNAEYGAIRILHPAALAAFEAEMGGRIAPQSRLLLDRYEKASRPATSR